MLLYLYYQILPSTSHDWSGLPSRFSANTDAPHTRHVATQVASCKLYTVSCTFLHLTVFYTTVPWQDRPLSCRMDVKLEMFFKSHVQKVCIKYSVTVCYESIPRCSLRHNERFTALITRLNWYEQSYGSECLRCLQLSLEHSSSYQSFIKKEAGLSLCVIRAEALFNLHSCSQSFQKQSISSLFSENLYCHSSSHKLM